MRSYLLALVANACIAASVGSEALAGDEATVTLRGEHRLEAMELREQQARESPAPDAPVPESAPTQAQQVREREAQDNLHERQLRMQTHSAHIRRQQPPGQAASAAQVELQQLRRERDAAVLQRELLRPLPPLRKR